MGNELWKLMALYLLAVNLTAFAAMGADKGRAKKGKWRISVKACFRLAVYGGGMGCKLGLMLFRHKTRHWYFRWGFPLLAALQAAGLVWLARNT